jgi:hypothetical protein
VLVPKATYIQRNLGRSVGKLFSLSSSQPGADDNNISQPDAEGFSQTPVPIEQILHKSPIPTVSRRPSGVVNRKQA